MQSHTNYNHNDTPRIVCLHSQRFISQMLNKREIAARVQVLTLLLAILVQFNQNGFSVEISRCALSFTNFFETAPLLYGKPLISAPILQEVLM